MTDLIPASIHESVKQDFKDELDKCEVKVKAYRSFISDIAKEIGCNQETEVIKAEIHSLVLSESKLKSIKDNRPLIKHPFDGLGEKVIKLTENTNQFIKLLTKKLKHGTN